MSDNQDNQQKNDHLQKPQISDSKKYGLLAVAGVLLIGAYFFGQQIEINPTYNSNNVAVANTDVTDKNGIITTTKELPQGVIIKSDALKLFPSDQILGDPSEKPLVTMIEYGSLTCPHCADFHINILAAIKDGYINSKKIQYIFRDYPLDGAALKATLLSKCDLSKRQAFLDLLYKKQADWTKGGDIKDIEKNLIILGKMGGLSSEKITECLNNEEMTKEILQIRTESAKLYNIEATPTILINNQKFSGGLKIDDLKNILNSLLAKKQSESVAPVAQ